MYRYDEFDAAFVSARVDQFRGQVERRITGELTEEQFRPHRLMNGLYLQLHAYMLRVAVPYGTLNSNQLRKLAEIAHSVGIRKILGASRLTLGLQFMGEAVLFSLLAVIVGVVIVGSGMSYHDLRHFRDGDGRASEGFDAWLGEAVTTPDPKAREDSLTHWAEAPYARECHEGASRPCQRCRTTSPARPAASALASVIETGAHAGLSMSAISTFGTATSSVIAPKGNAMRRAAKPVMPAITSERKMTAAMPF